MTNNLDVSLGTNNLISRQVALDAGFVIDDHGARPIAYKGPRFAPTTVHRVFTENEELLMRHLVGLAKAARAVIAGLEEMGVSDQELIDCTVAAECAIAVVSRA